MWARCERRMNGMCTVDTTSSRSPSATPSSRRTARRSASRSGLEGAARRSGVVGRPPGRRIEVEPRRPGDDHLARAIGTCLQNASLVVAEDERAERQDQPRVATVRVARVGRVEDPVLEREDRDARTRRGHQPRRAVTLLRHEHGGRVEVVDQALDAGELVHLGVDEASQRRPQLGGERRPDVQTVELERDWSAWRRQRPRIELAAAAARSSSSGRPQRECRK